MSVGPCQICGADLRVRYPRVVDPDTGDAFAIWACTSCEHGHTRPCPDDLGRYYAPEYRGGRHGITAAYCARRRVRWLERYAGAPGRVLDLGCGDGTFLVAAREKGWSPIGTEFGEGVERARAAGIDAYDSIEAAAGHAPFAAITAWHSLEHVRDPLATMKRAHALLAPGGTLILAVPDARGLQARAFGPHWFHLDVPRHLHHFGKRSLDQLLARSGFDVVALLHQELEYDVFGWLQSALDLVVPEPRLLFHRLSGKPTSAGPGGVLGTYALAAGLGPLALEATLVGTLARAGGTLVAVARRR